MALPLNPLEDPSSPYYLHLSDHAGLHIIHETLTGENFGAWKKSDSMAMAVKNKMGFLDGYVKQPNSDDALYSTWYRINAFLLSWLLYSISPTIRNTFLYFTNAKELWDEVQLRYGESDGPRLFQLKKSLGNLSQGSQNITDYYNSFKELWDEYSEFRAIPSCTCGRCTCNISETYQKLLQKESILKFLVGLNDSYVHLRSQILLNTEKGILSNVYSIFLQEESRRCLQSFVNPFSESSNSDKTSNDATAFLVKNFKKKSSVTCSHCGYQGHSSEKCFQIIGYRDKWKGPKGQRVAPGFKPQFNSNKNPQAHTVTNYTESTPISTNHASATTDFIDLTLYDKFLQFMQTQQTKTVSTNIVIVAPNASSPASPNDNQFVGNHFAFNTFKNSNWILDTGASDHMVYDASLYTTPTKNIFINIQLPTGNFTSATKIGDIKLNSYLTLHNVLYVPNFSYNLMSISTLTSHDNISVSFTSKHAILQDRLTHKMIGYADLHKGLYNFNSASSITHTPTVHSANSQHSQRDVSATTFWHFRLGHFPINKLSFLSDCNISNNEKHSFPCDICHFAKQKRLLFHISTSHASTAFDLIHMDVWGPYKVTSYTSFRYFLTIVDDYTRCTWVFLLKTKSEVKFHMINFYKFIEIQFQKKIKIIRTDNGTEFLFPEFYHSNGILHQLSCVETPQQNGRVERKHQHILQIARALLFQSCLPISFWSECILNAVHIINRLPTSVLQNKSPYELLYNHPPDYTHLKIFGCLAFASTICSN
ncbi:unnamed protein product [Cuscuta europaea]|uniref:Integrase catalytic domain-containing protein n=1 Tax=Cuscuta europaea TaxID=41803 RepID=A0A9P0ZFX4_CUSEU|nr:unnamed protein product [Cuscuta europaea]